MSPSDDVRRCVQSASASLPPVPEHKRSKEVGEFPMLGYP